MATVNTRLKRAELAGGLGALVLGAGLGAASPRLIGAAWPVVLGIGLVTHAWGMWDKHRIESNSAIAPAWANTLYWICWALLALVAAYLLAGLA